MFKKIAKLEILAVLKDQESFKDWRDIVKKANGVRRTNKAFLEPGVFEYRPDRFVYFTSRAISGEEMYGPNRNGDAFPWNELKASYETFIGKGFYIEHQEDSIEQAKGLVLDAVAHEDKQYIECLSAVDRKLFPEIAGQIESGIINCVSMSCNCQTAECTECGNIATNASELCEHCRQWDDEEGKIANVNYCKGKLGPSGKNAYERNRGIIFTGLSGVAIPADGNAHIFEVFASMKGELENHLFEYQKSKAQDKNKSILKAALNKLSKEEIKVLAETAKEVAEEDKKEAKEGKEEEFNKLQEVIDDAGQKLVDNTMKSAVKEVIEEKTERMMEPSKLMLKKVVAPKVENKLNEVIPQIEVAVKELAGEPVNASLKVEAKTKEDIDLKIQEILKKHNISAVRGDEAFSKAVENISKVSKKDSKALEKLEEEWKEVGFEEKKAVKEIKAEVIESHGPIPEQPQVIEEQKIDLGLKDREINEIALGDGWILKETNIDNKLMMEVFDREESTGFFVEKLPEELSEIEKVSEYRKILDMDKEVKENIKEEVNKMSKLNFKYFAVAGSDEAESLDKSFFVVKCAEDNKKMKIVKAKYILSQEMGDNIVEGKEQMSPEEYCKKLAEDYSDFDSFVKFAKEQKETFVKKASEIKVEAAKGGKNRFEQFSFNEKESPKEKLKEAGDPPVVSMDEKEAAKEKKDSEPATGKGHGSAVKKLFSRLPSNSGLGGEPIEAIDKKSKSLGEHARILRQAVEKQRMLEASLKEKEDKIALMAKELEDSKKEKEMDKKAEIISEITSEIKDSEDKNRVSEMLVELDENSLKALKSVLDAMNNKKEEKEEELNTEASLDFGSDQVPSLGLGENEDVDPINSVESFAQAWAQSTIDRMQGN